MSSDWHERTDCRLCGSSLLHSSLSLPPTPPANEFLPAGSEARSQQVFPLHLSVCGDCGHVQLPVVVDPSRLFRNYLYVSGTSPVFVDHFRRYAESAVSDLCLQPGSFVLEVGSNDGTLLRFFKELGMAVLGVDPAGEIAGAATSRGIMTIPDFFTPALARDVLGKHGPADLIVANNVFAHADDLHGMADAVSVLLAREGTFVFEVSYLMDVLDKCLFDTIYHEHLSYHHLAPLIRFFKRHGLTLYDAVHVPTHGGSIRCYVARGRTQTDRLLSLVSAESRSGLRTGYFCSSEGSGTDPILRLASKIGALRMELRSVLGSLRDEGYRVVGFGAPAKATTLTHCFDISSQDIDFIVDDAPLKQGRLLPGKGIPILPSEALHTRSGGTRTAVLVLAWNFAESIMRNHSYVFDDEGCFVVPVPDVRVVRDLVVSPA